MSRRIAIIGGGIWGLSTAVHLARLGIGKDVVLLERNDELASETTLQSAGQVGQLRGDPILAEAVGYTLDFLEQLPALTGQDPGFVRSGSVHLALTPGRVEQFRQLQAAAERCQIPVHSLSVAAAAELVPGLMKASVLSALHVPQDGYVDATQYAEALARAAQDQGVDLRCGASVRHIDRSAAGDWRLVTDSDTVEVELLAITAGPWTGQLAVQLGVVAPMFPIRLQQARTEADGVSKDHPVVRVPDASCYVRPERGAYLYGFFDPDPLSIDLGEQPDDFRTADVLPDHALVRQSTTRLSRVIPRLGELAIESFRQGMITCTPDSRFAIGPVTDDRTAWVATGCGGTGIAASGAVGRWLADGIVSGTLCAELAQYAIDRFGRQVDHPGWLRDQARRTSASYYRLPKVDPIS